MKAETGGILIVMIFCRCWEEVLNRTFCHPSDHQTPIRPQLVPDYKTKDSVTFKALTTSKRFDFLTGGSSQRPTMMGVDNISYNNVLSLDLSYFSRVSPILFPNFTPVIPLR